MVEKNPDPETGSGFSGLMHRVRNAAGFYRVRLYLLFVSLLLTLALVAYLVFSLQRYQGDQVERLEASYEQVKQLDALMLLLVDAETGERGFVITGNEVFLEPYHAAAARVDSLLDGLRATVQGHSRLREQLKTIEHTVDDIFAQLQHVITVKRTEGTEAATEIIRSQTVKQEMDRLRALMREWLAQEAEELADLSRRVDRATTVAETSIIVGFSLSGVFLLLALGMIGRESHRREKALGEATESRRELALAMERQQALMAGRERLRRFMEGLQTCQDLDEAEQVLANELPRLTPLPSGALAIQNPSRVYLEVTHSWGPGAASRSEAVFVPGDCHGLRRGSPAWCMDPARDLCCRHLKTAEPLPTVCWPLTAQNEILGCLILWGEEVPRLDDEERALLSFAAETLSVVLSNLQLQGTLRYQAVKDPLTGLYNRRHMEVSLERELARAKRGHDSLAVIMVDIDHFKTYNDSHGHDAADVALSEVAHLLSSQTRTEDVACRYGGEEFLLVLPGIEPEDAVARAHQIRARVEEARFRFRGDSLPGVTVSVGVALYPDQGETPEELINAADRALYRAKKKGRNRVDVAGAVQEP